MWDGRDRYNFLISSRDGTGQISGDEFSDAIRSYASNPAYKTFLEVGTWNGMGSTRAFADGFKGRGNEDYVFYSLECNEDKSMHAADLYRNIPTIHILNEVLWSEEPNDMGTVFPQLLTDEQFQGWHQIDLANMQACNVFLNREELPPVFDVVLLDGGEFTTYYDFLKIRDRCKILMLDDVATDKCKKIKELLLADPTWQILKEGSTRNGYLIAKRSTPSAS